MQLQRNEFCNKFFKSEYQLVCRVYQMGSCVNNPKYFKHRKYFFKTVKVVSSQSFNIFQASAT